MRFSKFLLYVLLAIMFVQVAAPSVLALGTEGEEIAVEQVDTGIDSSAGDQPAEHADILQYLASINTYLTYFFMFGVVWLLVTSGKLIYSLLKMFF